MLQKTIDRRTAIKSASLAGVGVWLGSSATPTRAESTNEKLNVAFVGIGGQGGSNLRGVAGTGQNVVALCDVDEQRGGKGFERFPKARRFKDFRVMFDKMEKDIDAVVVSTPDHTHFHPSMAALVRGKHLYCEKPMAHSVWEIREMTNLARSKGVATQLGVQRHTIHNMHRVVELIQAGTIGEVRECHSWIGGTRGMPKVPTSFPAVPPHIDWDLWLGPAKWRQYSPEYAPYKWRFWWDFGTGETGNWGCHILDIPFWALALKHPNRVDAKGPPVDDERTPKSMDMKFEFPTSLAGNPVTLHWYHANNGPPILAEKNLPHKGNNNLFIGSKGMLLCGFNQRTLLPKDKFGDSFSPPPKSIPDSPGFHREWVNACKGGESATCNFDYSGPMAETVILGNVAYRAGGGFDWNADELRAQGNEKANQLIRPTFRKGWDWQEFA